MKERINFGRRLTDKSPEVKAEEAMQQVNQLIELLDELTMRQACVTMARIVKKAKDRL